MSLISALSLFRPVWFDVLGEFIELFETQEMQVCKNVQRSLLGQVKSRFIIVIQILIFVLFSFSNFIFLLQI